MRHSHYTTANGLRFNTRHYHQLPLLTRQMVEFQIIDSLVCSGSYVRGSRIEKRVYWVSEAISHQRVILARASYLVM